MNTLKWLLRRELWENKGTFLWAPIVLGGVMILLLSIGAVRLGGDFGNALANAAQQQDATGRLLAGVYMANAIPIFLMMGFVAFFYCQAALYDERRDRSILFWKSLPVSDTLTVLSKVLAALVMLPVICIAAAIATSLVLAIVLAIKLSFQGIQVLRPLVSQPAFYLAPFQVIGLLPVYVLWALPTVGWLLMVSSWARSKVFLWAVGVPLLVIALMKWFGFVVGAGTAVNWVIRNVIARLLGGLVPGNWLFFDHAGAQQVAAQALDHQAVTLGSIFVSSWSTLASPAAWAGVVAGIAMIAVAIRLRRLRDEG